MKAQRSKDTSRKAKPPNRKTRRSPLYVLVEHGFSDRTKFDRAIFEATRKLPSGLTLHERLYRPDGSGASFIWRGKSVKAVREFVQTSIKDQTLGDLHQVMPDLFPPVITSVFPFSVIMPAGGVIVQGQHFGDQPGEFLLLGPAFQDGALRLGNLQWGDQYVAGVIPSVDRVPDQDAELQVITADGRKSNQAPCRFTANRQIRQVPGDIFSLVHFAAESNYDSWSKGLEMDGYTLRAFHGSTGSGDGTDVFTCELKNGWVFYDYRWTDVGGINGSPFGNLSAPADSPNITLAISWFHDVLGSAHWGIQILAIGPSLVPFQ
jgi:hypothetical protein